MHGSGWPFPRTLDTPALVSPALALGKVMKTLSPGPSSFLSPPELTYEERRQSQPTARQGWGCHHEQKPLNIIPSLSRCGPCEKELDILARNIIWLEEIWANKNVTKLTLSDSQLCCHLSMQDVCLKVPWLHSTKRSIILLLIKTLGPNRTALALRTTMCWENHSSPLISMENSSTSPLHHKRDAGRTEDSEELPCECAHRDRRPSAWTTDTFPGSLLVQSEREKAYQSLFPGKPFFSAWLWKTWAFVLALSFTTIQVVLGMPWHRLSTKLPFQEPWPRFLLRTSSAHQVIYTAILLSTFHPGTFPEGHSAPQSAIPWTVPPLCQGSTMEMRGAKICKSCWNGGKLCANTRQCCYWHEPALFHQTPHWSTDLWCLDHQDRAVLGMVSIAQSAELAWLLSCPAMSFNFVPGRRQCPSVSTAMAVVKLN